MNWIWLSILASLFFAMRYLIIKKLLSEVDTYLLAFAYRFFGFLFLLPLLLVFDLKPPSSLLFWKITIITSVLTALASMMQLTALQKYDMSSSVPFLAFIPLFMVLPVYFIYKELPSIYTFPGIVFLSFGGLVINGTGNQKFRTYYLNLLSNKGALLFLGVALIFGLTTSLDRIAILEALNSGFTYTFAWHIVSVGIFSLIFLNFKKVPVYFTEFKSNIFPFALQGFLGIAAFLCQMLAVEKARQINANVIYVKSLTLIYLFLSVLFGLLIFKEKNALYKIVGSLVMIVGAIIIMLFA